MGDANDDDDGDDADDQMEDSSQVMLRKEDPDFKPVVMDTNEQPEETNVRRSGRYVACIFNDEGHVDNDV